MWNGSRSGPRGGMPFCGDPRGEMFEGRNRPMPGFRGREGMNMGVQDRPPMDMRRFDYSPDMMGRNMGLLDRGRDSPRDFFMPENELDFRRRLEMEQNAPGYIGQGRPSLDMGGRDMQVRNIRGHNDQFMDMRERDRFRMDMPGFNMSPMDVRRRLAMESMDRNDHIRETERPQMGMNDIDGFSMDMPPRDRSVDFDRRGCVPPLNPRGRFESDMDFRNRMGQPGDFRDRPPQMFRGNDGMNLRGRPDLPLDRQGPEKDMLKVGEPTLRDREFPEQAENRSGFRGEDKSFSEEWCRRMNRSSNLPSNVKKRFPHGPGKEGELGEPSQFKDRERPSVEIPAKERGNSEFSRSEREDSAVRNWDNVQTDVPGRDPPHPVPQKLPLLSLNPSLNIPSKDKEGQRWSRDEKPDSTIPPVGRHPFFPDKNLPVKESHFSVDQGNFKGKDMPLDEGQKKGSLLPVPRDPQSNREGRRDQDYGDIDYRTSSAQKYDYILEDLQGPEKNLKTLKAAPPERSTASGSQDQDYRNANVQDKISKTIAISGIPKTATMQQILDAFAVRDGVPMQGMKIRDVVPGYSSDTAYVEFLNIEDAVHFMESNQGSVKVGSKTALLKYIQPERNPKEPQHDDQPHKVTPPQDGLLPCPVLTNPPKLKDDGSVKTLHDPLSQGGWQRSSTLTPEAWQQQVDKQLQQQEMEKQAEEWANQRGPRANQQFSDPVFKESRTMIIKNILPTTTVETILRSLDTFAYLDERNVRLVKGKTPGSKCFCFVDMDSHEHVTRLVDLLTKPRPIMIDGVRVYAEVAKPLKNQNYRRDLDKSNSSLLGCPPDVMEQQQQYFPQSHTANPTTTQGMGASAEPLQTEFSLPAASIQSSSINQGAIYAEPSVEAAQQQPPSTSDTTHTVPAGESEDYSYTSDTPDLSAFLYDATSGFYYDPQTTLYYDPNSRYFYNAQTQQYLYWDSTTKIYIPVEGENAGTNIQKQNLPVEAESAAAEELKTASEGAPERREDDDTMSRSEKKEKEKEDKPRSLAAFKIMKDMERWAKIQNRQKDSVRAPSPVLRSGAEDKKASKAADAAFAVFERKTTGGDDLFKKPLAPPKKDEKGSKKPMGSLGLLAADYAAGSDDEEEEKHEKHEAPTPPAPPVKSQPESQEKEDRLTDWKKMACLLCRRQFPSKDALIRHQQLSDLHKQNMEIHLKIKKSKRELEALENQEKEMHMKETCSPPDAKKRKQQSTWPSSSRDTHKGNERPGLGLESTERNKKDGVVWNYATYKQAVRKAMFARFKELE